MQYFLYTEKVFICQIWSHIYLSLVKEILEKWKKNPCSIYLDTLEWKSNRRKFCTAEWWVCSRRQISFLCWVCLAWFRRELNSSITFFSFPSKPKDILNQILWLEIVSLPVVGIHISESLIFKIEFLQVFLKRAGPSPPLLSPLWGNTMKADLIGFFL